MKLLPTKDYTIPGTTTVVVLRAWSMLQIENAKARRISEGDDYNGTTDLQPQILNKTTGDPVWLTGDAMKADLTVGQLGAISAAIGALTTSGSDLAAFRTAGEEAIDAGPAPDGEVVRA